MSIKKIIAIIFIFAIACGGGEILGTTLFIRSEASSGSLRSKVYTLCESQLIQKCPIFTEIATGKTSRRQ
ncbi:MAG: hypothetical protein GY750_01585 [Lentisphaerae bacterium]|nr:hypothetical protein [Lentisphaerota bacterium]MCP4100112.1 hypothetical protein [Lentisphaerota bacterium]